jgi:hypothetical protein
MINDKLKNSACLDLGITYNITLPLADETDANR